MGNRTSSKNITVGTCFAWAMVTDGKGLTDSEGINIIFLKFFDSKGVGFIQHKNSLSLSPYTASVTLTSGVILTLISGQVFC